MEMDPRQARLLLRRRQFLQLLSSSSLALSLGGLASCSGKGGGGPTIGNDAGAGVPGTPLTPTQRLAALQAVEDQAALLLDPATGAYDAAAMLAWLRTRTEFMQVGYSPDHCAWAIFTDGRRLIVGNDSLLQASPPRAPSIRPLASAAVRGPLAPARSPALAAFDSGIPSASFRFLNCWDALPDMPTKGVSYTLASDHDLNKIASMAEAFGYTVAQETSTTDPVLESVEGLKGVSGDGVFFWATHGGSLNPSTGAIEYALWTRTPATQANVEQLYADDFAAGRLAYYVATSCLDALRCVKRGAEFSRLAITPKFIKDYRWSFGPYSLAFVAACVSARAPFRDAFLAAGASVYAGWTAPVRLPQLITAARDFFELMFATNDLLDPAGDPMNVEPLLRPLDYGAIWGYLHRRGVADYVDPVDGTVALDFALNGAVPQAFQTLRPSINRMYVNEALGELQLDGGSLGTTPGRVVIAPAVTTPTAADWATMGRADRPVQGGLELTVKTWKSENVVCALPADDAAAGGYVQVWVDTRWSNVAQLTSWSGRFTLRRQGPGSLRQDATMDVLLRADLRGVRTSIEQTPVVSPIVPLTAAANLVAPYSASGSYTARSSSGCDLTVGWSAAGTLAPALGPSSLIGYLDPISRLLTLGLGIGVLSGLHVDRTAVCGTDVTSTSEDQNLALGSSSPDASPAAPPLQLTLDADFGIPAGTFQYAEKISIINADEPATVTITWGAMPAKFIPEQRLGGR
jgi:hypothetical protein